MTAATRGGAGGGVRVLLPAALLAVASAAAGGGAAVAQEAPATPGAGVTLVARADRRAITVGDPITVTLTVERPAGVRLTRFEPERAAGGLTVLGTSAAPPETLPGGRVRETRALRVTIYETGRHEVPGFTVEYAVDGGGEASVRSDPIPFDVASVLPAGGEPQPADIKPVAGMPQTPVWPWVALVGLLAAAVGWWLWRRRARPIALPPRVPAAPPRPAHEVAFEALERLLSSGLLERGRVKEFYIELAEIVRRYLAERFGVDTFERTSDEILQAMREARPGAAALAVLSELFGACDLVKFARHVPTPDETRGTVERAYRLIDETRPAPAAPAEPAGPPAAAADAPAARAGTAREAVR